MGNLKEIQKPGDFDWRAERVGFVNSLQVEPQAIPGRILGFIKNRQSANNEGNNPENAFWEGAYSVGQDRHGNEALVSSEVGAVRIRGSWFRGSHAMIDSMDRAAALKLVDIQRGIKSAVSLQTLLDQRNQFEAYQQGALALQVGQSMLSFALCGADVSHGVSLQKTTRINNGDFTYQTRLIGGLTDGAAQDLLERFSGPDNQVILLDDNKQDNAAYLALVGNINVDLKDEQFIQETINDIFQDRGEQQPKVLKVGPCQNRGVGAASESGKSSVANQTGILNPGPVFYSAESGGMSGGGGGGSEREVPVLSAPAFLLAASLPTSAVLITQPVASEVIFATALHKQSFSANSTVAKDENNNPVSPVLFEPVPLIPAAEQSLREMGKPLFILDHTIPPTRIIPVVFKTEPISMFQIIEENSEGVKSVVKEEWRQVQEASAPMIQLMEQKPVADKPVNLATVKAQVENKQVTVERQVSETEKAWQAETENRVIGATPTEQTFTVKQLRMTEQQPIFEKTVKELSLPLLEISSETAPVMVLRVELKPVVKADEAENFETEDETIFIANDLQTSEKKEIIIEIDQEKGKLFLVENFSVASAEAVKTEKTPDLQIKKLVWRIKARESQATEASILELELPKDQNQRLYAFYHFLQKVVKKVVGQDAIRTRQMTVIAEKEAVNFDLELITEIEYYLQLLRRKRNYAQAFAFVN